MKLIDFVKSAPEKPWNFSNSSGNPNITWDDVIANSDTSPWSYQHLSRRSEHQRIEARSCEPDKRLESLTPVGKPGCSRSSGYSRIQHNTVGLFILSQNANITMEHVLANPTIPWQSDVCIHESEYHDEAHTCEPGQAMGLHNIVRKPEYHSRGYTCQPREAFGNTIIYR
jgi:hypothetical protein